MRLRHRPAGLPGEASPDSELGRRLQAARLYVITPDQERAIVETVAAAAMRGGADVIQLRHKTLARGELLSLARVLRVLTAHAGRLFIVNDHADIALLSGADGVHLGPADITVQSARRVLGDGLLVGASASDATTAREAVAAGANYLGSGPAFATPIKSQKHVIGPSGIAEVAVAVGPEVPVFAIGGIDESNVAQLTRRGLRRVCVIRAVGDAADPESAARRLRAMLDR